MKYRETKKKSNISSKFSKEFQFLINVSSSCDFDEPIKLKSQHWFALIRSFSHIDFCGFARIWTLIYVESVVHLPIVIFHDFVAFCLICANVVWVESKWRLTSILFNNVLNGDKTNSWREYDKAGLLKPLQNKKGQKNWGTRQKSSPFIRKRDCFFVGYPKFFLALLTLKRL